MAGRTTSPPSRLKPETTYGGQDDKSTDETKGRTYLWRAGRQVHRGDRRRGLRPVASTDSSRAAPTTPHTAAAVASRVPPSPSPPSAATRCRRDSSCKTSARTTAGRPGARTSSSRTWSSLPGDGTQQFVVDAISTEINTLNDILNTPFC